jgi:Rps23 Pro-64 3,4-dihydroxylase Tpa1-like proline 4-hydroxylase
MPPHLVVPDFLDREDAAEILEYAVTNEEKFSPTRVGTGSSNQAIRKSLATRDLGKFRALLVSRMRAKVPELIRTLKVSHFELSGIDIQLVAHGEGAFYSRHIDTITQSDRRQTRVLSAVYYFHRQPRAFEGGALRLYAIGDPQFRSFIDISPEHNTLLVFPSWALHAVMPVQCESQRFADSRFAINIWMQRKRETAPTDGGAGGETRP